MIKKIKIEEVTTGMWIERLPGSWIERPFWRQSFLLTELKDLEVIKKSGIPALWINTDKGRDTTPVPVVQENVSDSQSETAAKQPEMRQEDVMKLQRESVEAELEVAFPVCEKVREAVSSIYGMSQFGRVVLLEEALEIVEKMFESIARNRSALLSVVRLKSDMDYTYLHSVSVCGLMISLAYSLELNEESIKEAGLAGLLHDIGMMTVAPEIRFKKGALTEHEISIVRSHPIEGYNMLKDSGEFSEAIMDVCLHHHERLDGSGYPDQLMGDEISQLSRMAAICSTFDALTTERPYKKALMTTDAIKEIFKRSVMHFDPTILEAFVKSVGIYPLGTLVRLKSDRLAIVVAQSKTSLLKPDVKAFYSIKSQTRITPEIVCLSSLTARDEIVSHEDAATWGLSNIDEMWR
jgi:HD-GYP domain-containing protein (c-di-GMP phosphodiesterase class II)